jgi:hypothetical protein
MHMRLHAEILALYRNQICCAIILALTSMAGVASGSTGGGEEKAASGGESTEVPAEEMPSTTVDFHRDIRPLLSDRCFACHGPDAEDRQAGLRIDDYDSLTEDRGGYQVVVPGDAKQSELVRRITSQEEWEVMPPPEMGKPLSAEQQAMIRRWVEEGAAWEQHWAYVEPVRVPTPELPSGLSKQASNWIDHFIFDQIEKAGGKPSEPADTTTLMRRLAFDLTGLPPTPDQLKKSQAAGWQRDGLERFVEELLATPEFGERMASYWLDLVRYADTVGYHGDQEHNISPYRDYVINALNDNLPFDRFTVEQIAGDLLEDPTEEQIVATGYNRLLQTTHEGGLQPKEYRTIYAADRVRNISAVWMGATVGCAQCHDHKYDPYTARDFYALSAFFADVDDEQHFDSGTNALPTSREPEIPVFDRVQRQEMQQLRKQLEYLEHRLDQPQEKVSAATPSPSGDSASESIDPGRQATKLVATASSEEVANAGSGSSQPISGEAKRDEIEKRIAGVKQRIEELESERRISMITKATEPRTVRFLPRGNWMDESGDVMQPAVPEFLNQMYPVRADEQASDERLTRLDLARWLVDAERGAGLLTARVFVNRLWMLMFGSGLSTSVEDFGGQGQAPSHPRLLDRLAIEFVRSGWDIKHMVRLMATSATYQQSSLESDWHRDNDPNNRLYARQNRFRLPAEMVRDTALAASGLLVRSVGGASVKPYQPKGYYRHLNFPKRAYEESQGNGQWRRGVYVHWQRQFLHPMMSAFDAPRREECTAQRAESNTPLAALTWLNDPSFVEAARGLAIRLLHESNSETAGDGVGAISSADDKTATARDDDLIERVFYRVTSRRPDANEVQMLQRLLNEARQEFADASEARAFLQVGHFDVLAEDQTRLAVGDLSPQTAAAWTTVARAVLNLNEAYTRN